MTTNGAPVPYDPDAERDVIGTLLLCPAVLPEVAAILGAEDFYAPELGRAFAVISDLHARGAEINHATVASELGAVNGTRQKLLRIQTGVPAVGGAVAYATKVKATARHRNLQRAARQVEEAAKKEDDEAIAEAWAVMVATAEGTGNGAALSPFLRDRFDAAALGAEPDPLSWLIRGILAEGTFGPLAGPKKSLKSYVALAVIVAVATGRPLFGQFPAAAPGVVLIYAGEGGRRPFEQRLRRMAKAFGVDHRDLPIHYRVGAAPVLSAEFRRTLARDLRELNPALVNIDPLYAFHGADIKAGLLNERAPLLGALSGPCVDAGATLLVNDHFNATGAGFDLDRITGAGLAEWADSWLLLKHRREPDVDAGLFGLLLEVGSRQWGGARWDLDMSIGRFDADQGVHLGDITWEIRPHVAGGAGGEDAETAILDVLADMPWAFTKTEVRARLNTGKDRFAAAWDALRAADAIVAERLPHQEGDREVTRDLWAPAGTIRPTGIEPVPATRAEQDGLGF